jgi:hypothetical protein
VFFPVALSAIGFLQARLKFCVNFGMRGVYNFDDPGKTFTVEQQEDLKKDRAKSMRMITIGIMIGVLIAIVYFFLPV